LLRACLQLLRHWDRPSRLSENTLVRALADRGFDVHDLDAMQRRLIETISQLRGRERIILHRCDILHEVHANVYRSLGLSRRQFYRERMTGIEHVTQLLLSPQAAPAQVEAANGLELQLAQTHALEQIGRWSDAVDILENLLQNEVDHSTRLPVLCRLVQLHAQAGRPSLADSYLRSAREESFIDAKSAQLDGAIVDVAEAECRLAFSFEADAELACRRATPVLRQHAALGADVSLCEALARSLTLESQIALERGDFTGFVAGAREAKAVVSPLGRPNRVVSHEVGASVAYSRLFDGSGPQRAEAELWKCYRAAADQSLVRQVSVVACSLARLFTRAGLPQRSLRIVSEVLPAARLAAQGEPLAVLLLEASEAAYWLGERKMAHGFLTEVKTLRPQGRLCNHVDLALAHLYLADGDLREALTHAESAEAGLARMKRTRYVGCALRLQAEVLVRMGERRRALRTAKIAAEILGRTGTLFAQRRAANLIDSLAPKARALR